MKRFQKPNLNLDISKNYELYELDDNMNVVKIKSFGVMDGLSARTILKMLYSRMPHRSSQAKEVDQNINLIESN
jgi:hypothetical protein